MAQKKQKPKIPHPKNSQLFSDHLSELRHRISIVFLFFISCSAIGWVFNQQILQVLTKPLNQPIFYTSPAGGFEFVLKIALFFGFLVSLPVFIYHLIRFIEPVLPTKHPRFLFLVLLGSSVLLLTGISFAYFVSLPAALFFLSKFANQEVQALISANEYFAFITRYVIGFGLIFQLPLVMIAINTVQKISTKALLKNEKWVLLASVVLAGILTPTPDIINQLIMAVPMLLLYQVTIVLLWLFNKKDFTDFSVPS